MAITSHVNRRLTAKQKRFVEEYIIDLNATQAAIRAGYSGRTATAEGQRGDRMSRGNIQVGQARCSRCKKMVKTERSSINWGTGDYLFIALTLGLWIVVKRLFNRMGNPWRCSVCGERV